MSDGDGGKEDASSIRGTRVETFTFPELMCFLFVVLDTNEKFNADKTIPVRLQTFNDTYTYQVDETTRQVEMSV